MKASRFMGAFDKVAYEELNSLRQNWGSSDFVDSGIGTIHEGQIFTHYETYAQNASLNAFCSVGIDGGRTYITVTTTH